MRASFISKVVIVSKAAMIVVIDATLCSKSLLLFLKFVPVGRGSLTFFHVWTVLSVVRKKFV